MLLMVVGWLGNGCLIVEEIVGEDENKIRREEGGWWV